MRLELPLEHRIEGAWRILGNGQECHLGRFRQERPRIVEDTRRLARFLPGDKNATPALVRRKSLWRDKHGRAAGHANACSA